MNRTIRIGGATVNQTPIDWKGNTSRILGAIHEAREHGVELLCFPELCITGYGCEDLFLSNWVIIKAWEQLKSIVPYCKGITVCLGLPIQVESKTYNGVCVVTDGRVTGIVLKQNMARDGVHYEPRWFDPWTPGSIKELTIGDERVVVGDLTFELNGVTFGFEICEDAWRLNRPAIGLQRRQVELILNPSASHFALGKSLTREHLVEGSSSTYHCLYGYVNLLGNEAGRMTYDGDILFAHQGKLLVRNRRLSFSDHQLLYFDYDFDHQVSTSTLQEDPWNARNEEFAQAASLALFDYLRKSRARGFVLSLSGGADSSCCAVLVAEMVRRSCHELGVSAVSQLIGIAAGSPADLMQSLLTCVYQSTENSSSQTLEAARQLASSINATFHHWTVDGEVASYRGKVEIAIERTLSWEKDDIALQNIQARARSPVVWLLANIKQSILLTTSNRSEGDVGYATMDGDTSGSLAPIAGVDKPFILQWLLWAQVDLHYGGLAWVNRLQPTAELRPPGKTQTDEKDLMPYSLLVAIEKLAIRDRKSPREVFDVLQTQIPAGELIQYIRKFFRMWAINQWKRERIAPSFHLDDLNVDPRSWCRFPILSGNFEEELNALGEN